MCSHSLVIFHKWSSILVVPSLSKDVSVQQVRFLHLPGKGAGCGKEGFDRLERATAGLRVEEVDYWDPKEVETEEQEVCSVLITIVYY